MLKIKNILALTLFIVIATFNIAACNNTNNTDKITETSESKGNNSETDIDESGSSIWNDFDFLIMTDILNGYDGAPVACPPYWRDNTGEMSISDMLASIDDTAFVFALPVTEGLYLKFSYNSDITPAEIKNAYYIKGNNETERHYLDIIKIPEEIGVYNFFVNLEWNDGTEEIVYFRVEVVESYESYHNRSN
jgi:hypothetical protein